MHATLIRAAGPFQGDPHFRHRLAMHPILAREDPGGQPLGMPRCRTDHHILVTAGFNQCIKCGAQRPGDGNQLVQRDPPVPGFEAAQG